MGYYALVTDSKVVNVIVADPSFIEFSPDLGCDAIVDVTELEARPSPGFAYDGSQFSPSGGG